ncbi:hypothetical protein ACFODQ_05295 [Comamonas sp. JC664]
MACTGGGHHRGAGPAVPAQAHRTPGGLLGLARKRLRQAGLPEAAQGMRPRHARWPACCTPRHPRWHPPIGQWLKAMERQRYAHATGESAPKPSWQRFANNTTSALVRLRALANKV